MSGLTIRKIKDMDNPLLFRKEYIFEVVHEAKSTPSRAVLREEIAKLIGVDKDLGVVRRIKTEFGTNIARVEVHIYSDHEKMMEIEPRYILKRNQIISE